MKETNLSLTARREFLGKLGRAATYTGAVVGAGTIGVMQKVVAKSESAPASFPTPDYDWTQHRWGYGVDATRCIGCLRCVEACKRENDVAGDAHHFRTWVERYVYLEGEDKPHIDSHHDPVNIEASGSEREYRFAYRYKDNKVE
jgi:ferredoxin